MSTRFDPDRDALAHLLSGEPRYRVDQLWDGLYRQLLDPGEMTSLPAALRQRLETDLPASLREVARSDADGGDTVKWLWELADGARIETVLMHYDDRSTVCISTQAGCAMGCTFCATGQAGFERNLSVGEIVEQVVWAARAARPRRVSNVVFMGMGEPLANAGATRAAIDRLHDAVGISARHLTVSTVGIVPGIRQLTDWGLPVNLAVSLHAANDELRNELVPINRRYPLDDLVAACRDDLAARGRRLSLEWAMIDGVNDRSTDATELADLAGGLRAHVNLIPLNRTPGYPATGSPPERIEAFRDALVRVGVNATIRRNRGTTIDAACGQLRAAHAVRGPVGVPFNARGR